MRCEEIKDKIDAYLESGLNEGDVIKFEDHLRACRNCQMEMESIKKCINMMKDVFSAKKPPSGIKKRVFEKVCCNEKEKKFCCPPDHEF